MKFVLLQFLRYVPMHGGGSKINRLLLQGLAARGHDCHVVTRGRDKVSAAELAAQGLRPRSETAAQLEVEDAGVTVYLTNDGFQLIAEAQRQLRALEPDWVLVSAGDPSQTLLEAALELAPQRVVYLAHDTISFPFGPLSFEARADKAVLFQRLAGMIAISQYVSDYARRWGNVASTVLGMDVYGAGPHPRFGRFDAGHVTLINPCAYKGLPIFLELARLMPQVPFAGVLTWGTTPDDRAALERLPNISLWPPVDDIDDVLRRTRVLLVPSLWDEAFGLVVVEAMLRGIPVLASHMGGLPEAKLGVEYLLPVQPITHYLPELDAQGFPIPVTPPQDVTPWLTTLRHLLTDQDAYTHLAERSYQAAHAFVRRLRLEAWEEFFSSPPPRQPAVRDRQALLKQVQNLSPERRRALRLLLQNASQPAPGRPTAIPVLSHRADAPLSSAQQRLWFLDQLEPGNYAYNIPTALALHGRVQPELLERSLNYLAERHEAFRTSFHFQAGRAVQQIEPALTLTLPVIDLSAWPPEQSEALWRAQVRDEIQRTFNLSQAPLARAILWRLAADAYVLCLNMHHIITDGWSIGILIREWMTLYQSLARGETPNLPPLAIQYADFAAWQQEWLCSEQYTQHLAYWQQQLADCPTALALPTDYPRPALQTYGGATVRFELSAELSAAIRQFSQAHKATPFMTLLAAFKVLLYRYSGQGDLTVGTPAAGRTRAECEPIVGFFINTLALRSQLTGEDTFVDVLGQVQHTTRQAYAHQDMPFEKLVEALRPARDLSRSPFFQVMFSLHNEPRPALELPDARLTVLNLEQEAAKFDLELALFDVDEQLVGLLDYNTALFRPETAARLTRHFQLLLAEALAAPEKPVSRLGLLSAEERQQILYEWNATARPYDLSRCLPAWIEEQVARTPTAPAVVYGSDSLTYAALNRRANQLGRYLRELGVGPDTLVAVCMTRALELPLALLAVLKAGGAYTPLEPDYPLERLAFMLADAAAPVVLTQTAHAPSVQAALDLAGLFATVVHLDAPLPELALFDDANLEPLTTPDHLAYVIYTSGSTGQPKGAMNTHRGICNRLLWMQEAYGLDSADSVLQKTPFTFDVSVWEFFWPLMTGARLVMAAPEEHKNSAYLARIIQEEHITTLHFVPPMLYTFLSERSAAACGRCLKRVICSGEALPSELQARFFEHLPQVALHNLYGPTEAAIDVTAWACRPQAVAASVPIGRPIANTQIYILNAHLEPAPIGVAGELYIGGVNVGRGYLKRPDLTAQSFIRDPFSPDPQARLYKTGDLARFLADGAIEFLGRLDHQVKLRGYRIELGEIEAVLRQHPAIYDAVVLARADQPDDRRLVAYLVPHADRPLTTGALQRYLREKFPPYMLPAAFVWLAALPLTANGKINRRLLPPPEGERPELETQYVPPQTELEQQLAAIVQNILHVEKVGLHDNFFDLGGHSLLLAQLHHEIRTSLGLHIPLLDLFRYPTLRALAQHLGQAQPVPDTALDQISERGARLRDSLKQRQAHQQQALTQARRRTF